MYNLFVSGHDEAWEGEPYLIEAERCVREYTDTDIIKRYGQLDATSISELQRLPCIFAYEFGTKKPPKFGVIRDITRRHAEHPDRKPVTDCTVNHDLTLLRHMFNKCIEWGFAKVNPMAKVELFKLDNGRTRHLSAEEVEKLLAACDLGLRALVLTALQTGIRKKELQSLIWSAIDLVHGAVTVDSCYSKNGEARTIPLTGDLAHAFQRLKDERKPKPDDAVFTYEGRPWKTWRKSFNTALKGAGIRDFRWHDLRHCFGSWLALNGVNDKARMELMGHKDPKMTMRYTHLSPGYKRQAMASLPQFGKALMESQSQQISQQAEEANVLSFSR